MRRLLLVALPPLLALGCLSPAEPESIRWFEPARPARSAPMSEHAPRPLALERVTAAPALGTAMAWRLSAVEMAFDSANLWVAEPSALVADALREALFDGGPFRSDSGLDAPRLAVHVRRFEGTYGAQEAARVQLLVTFARSRHEAALTRSFDCSVPIAEPTPTALAGGLGPALDRAVRSLAEWLVETEPTGT